MRRPVVPVLLLVLAFPLAVPAGAEAWGFEAHRFIMARAIGLMPPELRPFFEARRTFLVEHVVDPDLWRTAGWEAEPPRHFLDMDAYGPYPFKDLPHDEATAVRQRGREFVTTNGTLPWRTTEIYAKLVEAFRQTSPYSRDNVAFFTAILAHYLADANVPFHAATNYDGQLTGQWGIHSRFETELFERYRERLTIAPPAIVAIADIREFTFATLTDGFTFVQPILDADRAAVGRRELYDDGYFAAFFPAVRGILEARLSDSIGDVVSVVTAAWIEAGRPAVAVELSREPRRVRR
jgi:Zinc dependent phospholipase C